MVISRTPGKKNVASNADGWRHPLTFQELFTLSDEERIRRMYDMTPKQALDIMREAGLLTKSGRLKRCYR